MNPLLLSLGKRVIPVCRADISRGYQKPTTDGFLEAALGRADQAEAKYRSLIEMLPAITYAEDLDSGQTFAIGPRVDDTSGIRRRSGWVTRAFASTASTRTIGERVVAACELANIAGEPYSADYKKRRDGRTVWVRDEAVLVRGSNGQPLCWQGVGAVRRPQTRSG